MTAVIARPRGVTLAVAIAGLLALVARPPLLRATPDPTRVLVVLFVALLAAGALVPVASARTSLSRLSVAVLAVGVAAFALGRVLGGGDPPAFLTFKLVALNTLAAVAEEAFFRRLVFDTLRPGGDAIAVVGSALLFSIVHVPVYGLWVLPIDLAAGLVLSWQRWTSGTWSVPAVTHVLANLLVVI